MQQLKMLQYSFCRIEKFSVNNNAAVSGWIAEHYVAISRCFVHIMSNISDIINVEDDITMVYFNLMIQSTMCFVYHIMSPFEIDTITIENYIKVFYKACIILRNIVMCLKPTLRSFGIHVAIFCRFLICPTKSNNLAVFDCIGRVHVNKIFNM